MANYFLVSLSNRTNLDLCIKHGLAGFPSSGNGFWTYLEIEKGDLLSFLYGAQVWHLYRVKGKVALEGAHNLPPWPLITFQESGKTYYFPFRLYLEPVRSLRESLVRPEFAYVAEDLLLRGGYRKTHFQADQTTLQAVSQLGDLYSVPIEPLRVESSPYTPCITTMRANAKPPEIYPFSELILQVLIKKHLARKDNLDTFLNGIGLAELGSQDLEVLGERALAEGHVDILIKEAVPIGTSSKILIEVKAGVGRTKDIDQLQQYVDAVGSECIGSVLIARAASSRLISFARDKGVHVLVYSLHASVEEHCYSFGELLSAFRLDRP